MASSDGGRLYLAFGFLVAGGRQLAVACRATYPRTVVKELRQSVRRVQAPFRRFEWTEPRAALLGMVTDEQLARDLGITYQTVARERKRRGIAPFRPLGAPVEWTEEMIALLGTDSDRQLAAVFGIGHNTVFKKRSDLGIPPYVPPVHVPDSGTWTAQAEALLGTMADRALARKLGVSPGVVSHRRRKLGIPLWRPPPPRINWTDERIQLLGIVTDHELSRRWGISIDSIKRKRDELGIPPCVDPPTRIIRDESLAALLQRRNAEVIAETGLSKGTVSQLRREMGKPGPGRRWRWTPEIVARMARNRIASSLRSWVSRPGRWPG